MESLAKRVFRLDDEQWNYIDSFTIEGLKVTKKENISLLKEILEMINQNGWEKTQSFLDSCESLDEFYWNQPGYVSPYLFSTIKQEEAMKLSKPKPIKNLDPCKKCGSLDIRWSAKQIRAGDEGTSVLVICANCGLRNRVS